MTYLIYLRSATLPRCRRTFHERPSGFLARKELLSLIPRQARSASRDLDAFSMHFLLAACLTSSSAHLQWLLTHLEDSTCKA